ncbi:MAG TPA: AcvB/VirJ family lysyl-phosphatidylglycerol hydrolase [Nevskiaceae bacterium]|nr:AcvB/VirJ family lysyl-phosphatidylglycerol hydrolase [Nevskiaceae bacterium]
MKRALIGLVALIAACSHEKVETISHGRFPKVEVVRGKGDVQSVVMLITDLDGWTPKMKSLANTLAAKNALVIGIPLETFYAELQKEIGGCEFTDGDLENLSHFVQAYSKLGGYTHPILVGDGEGAAFAAANLMQAPDGTFAGAVTARFAPHLKLKQELCAGDHLVVKKSGDGFDIVLPSSPVEGWSQLKVADASAFAEAVTKLAEAHPAATSTLPPELVDLPIMELPADDAKPGAPIAIFWSGDGGWAGLDEEVANALNEKGVSIVGVDSLRYFWASRTPEKVAADIERIQRVYTKQWRSERVLLVGYSQGADILPFALNKLSADARKQISLAVAMGLGDHAVFEFHLANWIGPIKQGYDTLAEVRKIQGTPFLCIYGEEEDDTICPKLEGGAVRVVKLPGSHHFNGDYGRLAEEILKAAG